MLESYFTVAPMVVRLRLGVTGSFIDAFATSLRERGYAYSTGRLHLRAAAHLGTWMDIEGLAVDSLDQRAMEAFAEHLASCTCSWRTRGDQSYSIAPARQFVAYLRDQGVVPDTSSATAVPEIVEQFEHWMHRHRGVTASTLSLYRPILVELVTKLGAPQAFTAATLREFVCQRAARHGRSRTKTVVSALRMFLRYLVVQGLCESRLVDAIPTIAEWRLSSLPLYLSPNDVERIVGSPDLRTAIGRRDHAMLLLLARLGVRAGDVAGLRLADIDWRAGTLLVSGKGRRVCQLPLPQDVGDAILAYLGDGRPGTNDDHIFLCERAPRGRLHSATVSYAVVRAARRGGVKIPRGRAHVLRHSLATALVRQGVALPAVGALLRHRSEQTTVHYAKVNVPALRKVALPWPLEVSSC